MKNTLTIFALFTFVFQSLAACAYYNDVPLSSRPSDSVFDTCCCIKTSESKTQKFYNCSLTKEKTCPANTQKYPSKNIECPGNLIFTSYTKK